VNRNDNPSEINFCSDINQCKKKVNIVHSNSALQYSNDVIGVMAAVDKIRPEYIILIRMPVTIDNESSYFTVQEYNGSYMHYRFSNLGEIENIIVNYKKIHQSNYYDQSMSPEKLRSKFGHYCNIVNVIYERVI